MKKIGNSTNNSTTSRWQQPGTGSTAQEQRSTSQDHARTSTATHEQSQAQQSTQPGSCSEAGCHSTQDVQAAQAGRQHRQQEAVQAQAARQHMQAGINYTRVFKKSRKRFIKIDKNKGEVIYEDFKFRFVKY